MRLHKIVSFYVKENREQHKREMDRMKKEARDIDREIKILERERTRLNKK